MPLCAGFLEPRKSRLVPSKSMFNAENFICSFSMSVSISAQFTFEMSLAAQNRWKIHKNPYFGIQGHLRSEFGGNREPVYSNLGLISHHYRDTATFWLKIANFSYPFSFSALVLGDTFQIYGKALLFLKLVFQAADGKDLVILACTIFDWSTRVMDGQTELRWLRRKNQKWTL